MDKTVFFILVAQKPRTFILKVFLIRNMYKKINLSYLSESETEACSSEIPGR